MPVALTGDSRPLFAYAVPSLAAVSPQVRAHVRDPGEADTLRALGAKVAIARPGDDRLTAVLWGAHTVVHVLRGNDVDQGGPAVALEEVLAAAAEAGVRRTIVVRLPSGPESAGRSVSDALRERLASAPFESVLLLASEPYGAGHDWITAAVAGDRLRATGSVPGRTISPVYAADVAAVIAAADDRARLVSGSWAVRGPDTVQPVRLLAMLNAVRSSRHRTLARLGRSRRIDVSFDEPGPSLPDAFAEFGVSPTPLATGLPRALEDAERLDALAHTRGGPPAPA